MPIYEYRCNACGRTFAFLYGVARDSRDPACPACEGKDLSRLISRIARVRSEEAMLDALADPTKIGDFEDPRSLAKWAKNMGSALGDEVREWLWPSLSLSYRNDLEDMSSQDHLALTEADNHARIILVEIQILVTTSLHTVPSVRRIISPPLPRNGVGP
jgi:putative FmdB family regulatory protein